MGTPLRRAVSKRRTEMLAKFKIEDNSKIFKFADVVISAEQEKGEKLKIKLADLIAVFGIAMLLVSVLPVLAQPKLSRPANAMWIEDTDAPYWAVNLTTKNPAHTIGYRFRVTVWLNVSTVSAGADGVDTWQVQVNFNPAHLKAVAVGYTAGSKSKFFDGLNTVPVTPTIGTDFVLHGETCVSPDYRVIPYCESLFWIEFEVTSVPAKGETLTSLISIDPRSAKTYVVDTAGTKISLTLYACHYEFKWEAPPSPYMAVEHDGFYGVPPTPVPPSDVWPLCWGPYPPKAFGSAFDVKVYIADLAAAWGLTNASFSLLYNATVIDVLDGVGNITLNDAVWDTSTSSVTYNPGKIDFVLYPKAGVVPSGKVLVATIKFTIMLMQGDVPPLPMGYYDSSRLEFSDVKLMDHMMEIPTAAPKEGEVRLLATVKLPLPWLEVSPKDTVLGPELAIGKEFEVNIIIKNLHWAWYLIAYQVRLTYDPTLIKVIKVTEGPFLQDSRWNLHGTFFISGVESDGKYGPHIWLGGILLPNNVGVWDQTVWPQAPGPDVPDLDPPVNPVLATIRFKAIAQNIIPEPNLTCRLDILPFRLPGEDRHFIDKDGHYIPTDTAKIVNGTYTVLSGFHTGRRIDLYGGANNAGYGAKVFPDDYNGRGPNKPMDLVIPQSEVYLYAEVTYNLWPVQSKAVTFEIIDNKGKTWAKFVAITNASGIASITFRMPWVCENPEQYLGVWTVVATTNLADQVINDTLTFHYDYMVRIWKVTTDKYYYAHEELIAVTVEYGTHAMKSYPALFTVTVTDELGVPIGMNATYSTTVGEAEYCKYNNASFIVTITIPKWAYAGIAYVHVCCFDKEPVEGGFAWCPEYTPVEICILPW